ncbi:hypothetical protein ACAG26_03415 [Mycobacterium sp. pUA109]|uniref:hypothetical protein n=1 Tax=Mycobacterium sp. pUA109 TaxID=3238982 RepID=UPI00351B5A72
MSSRFAPPLLAVALTLGLCGGPATPAAAAAGCPPAGDPAPPGAAQRQVGDLDGDGRPDTLWIAKVDTDGGAPDRFVGVSTASAANSEVQIVTGSPMTLDALAVDAQNNDAHQIIVSHGRGANLYAFAQCRIQTVVDDRGVPFVFDLENVRGTGTGVGCVDLGDGRRLAGLQALPDGSRWTVRRTAIDLDGTTASIGRSDTVTADSAQDPVVTSAHTISCGDLSIDQDGVHEP